MTIIRSNILPAFKDYLRDLNDKDPVFILGDAAEVLRELPDNCIDFCMTSPPYWAKREYQNGGIGLEADYADYLEKLLIVFAQVKRVLKPTGSFWLNMGDTYVNKGLVGVPWRLAIALMDQQGWVMRNSIIWNKLKGGPDNTKDRLRNIHEPVFHFVKSAKSYYYDVDAVRSTPGKSKVVNGAIVSATGVTGVRYRRQIELSTALTEAEKIQAQAALDRMLDLVRQGDVADFRMIIRGQQRTTHSDSELLSGRARELAEKGYYFLLYHPKGSKPSDVWEIIPEDTQRRTTHFAPYPADLCRIPILTSCPPDGVVLDPFCGTGTTMAVAQSLGRKSLGIDVSETYIQIASERYGNGL